MSGGDNRRWRRFERRWPVRWSEGTLGHAGVTKDVSVGGAFIASRRLPGRERVRLQLFLTDGRQIELDGRVARRTPCDPASGSDHAGFAIEYSAPSPALGVELHDPVPARSRPRSSGGFATVQGVGTSSEPSAPVMSALLSDGEILQNTYVIARLLGAGGMGEVYEAHDVAMNRRVAIKVALPETGDDSLEAEARALAAFHDDGLPTVHALGRHGSLRFLVMEYLRGSTLLDVMQRHEAGRYMPLSDAVGALSGIARALGVIHAAGLAHRDLKPANVMLVPPRRVVLLDFGIVRQERHIADHTTASGSPHYMAPESITRTVRVGEAHLTDLYSLGVTAFELLTGRRPIDEASTRAVLESQLTRPVVAPSSLRSGVPRGLDDLVCDLLQKNPHDRPDSISTVSERLTRVQRDLLA